MVSPAGVEPATYALGGRRAIQLCHGDYSFAGGIIVAFIALKNTVVTKIKKPRNKRGLFQALITLQLVFVGRHYYR